MRWITSYFKPEVMKQGFRSVGWIGIGYFLVLLFVLPLQVIMYVTNDEWHQFTTSSPAFATIFDINSQFQFLTIIIVPVITGIFAFRYLQLKSSADFIHSLPLKRGKLFDQHYLIGYLMMIIPLTFIAVIMYVLSMTMDVGTIYQMKDIGPWFGQMVLVVTLLYVFTVLIGQISGISAVQGGLSYIFLLFPYGITILIFFNLEMLLHGYYPGYRWEENIIQWSPLLQNVEQQPGEYTSARIWSYLIASIVIYLLARWLYTKRPVEAATQAIAFSQLKPVFKFGITFCFMLVGGMYFGYVQGQHFGWTIFGYLFGSLLGYVLSEMLIQKTWRVFHQWRGFLVYIGVSMLIVLSLVFDWYGYETRIPNANQVDSVLFYDQSSRHHQSRYTQEELPAIKNQEVKEMIVQLHEYILENDISSKSYARTSYEDSIDITGAFSPTDITFVYNLDNGRKIKRQYFIPDRGAVEEYLQPIMNSEAFKKLNRPSLFDDQTNYTTAGISANDTARSTSTSNQQVIQKLITALQKDYLAADYQTLINAQQSKYHINFSYKADHLYSMRVPASYTNTIDVLEEEQLITQE
ncbi:multidrug ABC transporter permease [Gracilibacillus halophilus YIM-C55.5]|uniref:Multidrug ABC transporter permease n=1 Tax=Gracilibacillus halophilus YIM-C55.5 TaxID=1308866 RepID=N4WVQ7_9BACI|nr:DUF6449 domain-containing protein [Gracilibacillus halophilus]ENH97166.1 multidrug ABC transporter permease [Gracilibacillus halophilus YIM-C55.5]